MLEEVLASPGTRTLVHYLIAPETRLAVVIPGVASLAILGFYTRRGRVSHRLQLLWMLALGVSFYCARWEITEEVQRLYIYSAFSVACLLLLFIRIYVAPALVYALTFLALWWVDVAHALCRALECGVRRGPLLRGRRRRGRGRRAAARAAADRCGRRLCGRAHPGTGRAAGGVVAGPGEPPHKTHLSAGPPCRDNSVISPSACRATSSALAPPDRPAPRRWG